jgi:TPR repeat protein
MGLMLLAATLLSVLVPLLPDAPPAQPAAEVTRLIQGCKDGKGPDCGKLARMYAEGTGVPKDADRAVALRVRACDLGEPAECLAAGRTLANGDGVARDLSRALDLLATACDAKVAGACDELASARARFPEDLKQQAATCSDAAAGRTARAMACLRAATAYAKGAHETPVDRAKAQELYAAACGLGVKDPSLGLTCPPVKPAN